MFVDDFQAEAEAGRVIMRGLYRAIFGEGATPPMDWMVQYRKMLTAVRHMKGAARGQN